MTARLRIALYLFVAGAFPLVLALRIWLAHGLPLWMDETWTAVIASQPTWAGFHRQVWLDANAPLYYLVMWLWPGPLRLPSLLFMIAAGLAPIAWRRDSLGVAWGALLFFWAPGILLSADARSYALLFLLSTVQTIVFVRLLDAPSARRAVFWVALAALSILTHYFAAFLGAVQGAAFLIRRRREAVRAWPAILALAPAAAWGAYHWPRLAVYSSADVAWYETVSPGSAVSMAVYTLGPASWIFVAGLVLILAASWRWRETTRAPESLAACASTAALALMIGLGMTFPFLAERYTLPAVPGILLGVAMLGGSPGGRLLVCCWFLIWAMKAGDQRYGLLYRSTYGFQVPVGWLARYRPTEMVYAFDYAGARALAPDTTEQLGRYFFRKRGLSTLARMVVLGGSPSREFVANSTSPRPAILWFYGPGRTADVAALERTWRCHRWGNETGGTLVCAKVSPR